MASTQGAPTYLASGFIYGIAQDGSQPPNTMLSDIAIKGLRVGGAQTGCPPNYAARFAAVKAYYAKAKAVGATLLLLVHDLWGADGSCSVTDPGDGGDWTKYTSFMTQLISDVQANQMTGADVRWELWNEPDLNIFWKGTQAQWLEMWRRGYQQVRAAIPGAVFEGPSVAGGPGGSWATAFFDYVKTNDVAPNYVSWHEEGGGNDPVSDANTARAAISSRAISGVTGYDANEYGTSAEQNPGHSAWFIARLERAGIQGLRGNWGSGSGLYSTMAALTTNSWQANSQWWIYKRYADQTGVRTSVTAGSQVDAVAYQDSSAAKSIIVVGNKGGTTGSVNVVIKNVPPWLQSNGTAKVLLERMPSGSGALAAPTSVSSATTSLACNALTVPISWTAPTDGYAVTLTPR
jgi:hypothetical protein